MLNHVEAVQEAKMLLDREWFELLLEAKQLGLTYQEVQVFLQQAKSNN